MARGKEREDGQGPSAISIVGPGMRLFGECVTDGTVRIEGRVHGTVYAGKAVVVGKDGVVEGDLRTQDAVIAGSVQGTVVAASRLEVHGSARIEGGVRARRLQLAEGAILNGEVRMGEVELGAPPELPGKGVHSDSFGDTLPGALAQAPGLGVDGRGLAPSRTPRRGEERRQGSDPAFL